MNKNEFLSALQKRLRGLPKKEQRERLNFYSEMIDDRIEEGLSEEDAVIAVGTVDDIDCQISQEIKSANNEGSEAGGIKLRAWETALLILGSPIWISLLAAAFAVGISLYAVLWSVLISLWAIEIPFIIFSLISKHMFFVCRKATQCCISVTQKGVLFVKKTFGKRVV